MARLSWTIDDIVTASGGNNRCAEVTRRFSGIAIDSRQIAMDELFVAICGEFHDGHRFADEVVGKGVRGVMVNRESLQKLPLARWRAENVACIAVTDTTRALGDLAAYNRKRSGVSVVAITGSNGKTSTRQMTAAVLSRRFKTLVPEGNFNNAIGLPLTLLGLQPDHQWAVLELGMNHFGEIRRLGEICRPDIGVITNIGPAHLEGVGSIEGVTTAKAELLETIRSRGTVVLNMDDERVGALVAPAGVRTLGFGRSPKTEVRAVGIKTTGETLAFSLSLAGKRVSIRLRSPGKFMVENALAAAAVGHACGLSPRTSGPGWKPSNRSGDG